MVFIILYHYLPNGAYNDVSARPGETDVAYKDLDSWMMMSLSNRQILSGRHLGSSSSISPSTIIFSQIIPNQLMSTYILIASSLL